MWFAYISPQFLLGWWLSQPALEEDLSAAHVGRCLLSVVALQMPVCHSVHDGSWRLASLKCCRRLALPGAVRSPHLIKITVVLVGDVAGRSWWYRAQRPAQNPGWGWAKKKKRKKGATRLVGNYARSWRGVAGKLNWCRERKYRRVSAVCFPNSYHAHRAEWERAREREGGMGCAAGMNRMGEQLATKSLQHSQTSLNRGGIDRRRSCPTQLTESRPTKWVCLTFKKRNTSDFTFLSWQ